MCIDLSTVLPRCDHCILGKQTCSSVPKVREGIRASCPLECVFINLCGPMPCASHSGHLYFINLIDNFSSYVWSLPLRSKDEAAPILQSWHHVVENQSNHCLKILVSDNGELISKSMWEWSSLHGIDHQMTAPYTSAHNGCTERLHQTILDKACAMHLSCNAPASLWDEFCTTLHLYEIGCHAFALIQTANPKIYQQLCPCILIGYAPHVKAYHLWDTTTSAMFNSFHVTFLEHLD